MRKKIKNLSKINVILQTKILVYKMRKILTFPLIIFGCMLTLYAQKYTPMRAYNLYYEQNFVAAKECIDQCVLDEKYKAKANTWLYKANIDYRVASDEYSHKQQDSSYTILHPNTPQEAFDAFKMALTLNKNIEASEMMSPEEALPRLYPILFIQGVNELIANNFENAKNILAKAVESYEIRQPEYPLNGELYYYYAYALEMLNDETNAQKYYQKAIDDGSQNINVILRLLESYKKEGRTKDMQNLILQGKKNHPNNPNILVAEIDYYYFTNEPEKAKELLQNLPQNIYQSPDAIINVANFYIKEGDYVEAESLLKKANQRTPNNYIIVHNLGVCCDHIGNDKFMEANRVGLKGNKNEADILNKQATDYLQQAANYFEKALVFEPNDTTLLFKLKEIYLRLLQNEKAAVIEEKINSLK